MTIIRLRSGKLVIHSTGPFTEEDGTMNGSLVVVEAASLQAARAIADGDPFAKAGVFAAVEVRPWLWTINAPDEEE